eukprot:gb/GECH01000423.1/.p1 GENE.gb/GECH01000423.1/~~gb/GECH01000423.1/.p1  ORF type:complete len:299 (+),score=56.09 gb/GECH01000423.1/:1-897(+)
MSSSSSSSSSTTTDSNHSFQLHGWSFTAIEGPIYSTDEMDRLSSDLGGVHALPEMVFRSRLSAVHHPSRSHIHFTPDMALCGALQQSASSSSSLSSSLSFAAASGPCGRNTIKPVRSMHAVEWERLGVGTRFERRDDGMDWTFSTPYAGHGSRDGDGDEDGNAHLPWTEDVPVSINYDLLRRRDPILFFRDIILFEDELHDCGTAQLRVKIRVMDHSFLILQRFWLRVDNMMVRIIDTRMFHEFGSEWVVRDWSLREGGEDVLGSDIRNPDAVSEPHMVADRLPIKQQNTTGIRVSST